ncbi:hypothetical protein HELRODRAFT_79322, partial [Helobdella robusta]|uniref:BAR domain-containing protein n=1 Tax=Helobdella robusta TaxID=6412 RepID=T1G3M7_HELRO
QQAEEKLGQAVKTEYDAHLESLITKAMKTKKWSEQIVNQLQVLIDPNFTSRLQSMVMDSVSSSNKSSKPNPFDELGATFVSAGNDMDPTSPYGETLVKSGEVQQKIAEAKRSFIQTTTNVIINPLKIFLDGDMKTIERELKTLEMKRLDLDAVKTKQKKAANKELAATLMEPELRLAQSNFDRQAEVVKQLLLGITSTHAHHLKCLQEFIISQRNYFDLCLQYTTEFQDSLIKGFTSAANCNN